MSSPSTMKSRISIFVLISCLVCTSVMAQVTVHVTAKTDKQKVLLGEPIRLTVEVQLSGDAASQFPEIDSIPHFEFSAASEFDTSQKDGYTFIKGVYTIASFDSGHWVIPSFHLGTAHTDSIPVDVVFSDFDASKPYNDIKDIIPVEEKKKSFPWLLFAGGAVVVIVLLYLLLRKKKQAPVVVKPVVQTDPYKEAMLGLEQLKGKTQDVKAYYSGLVSVFRVYIFRKKGLLSLQKTTDDLIIQLRAVALEKDLADRLNQALRLSDFVKFAKYEPGEKDHTGTFNVIREAIEKTEQLP